MDGITTELAALLKDVRRPGDFFALGTVDLMPPRLEVEGVGPVSLPLLPVQAEQLKAVSAPAPYGRGEATIVDTSVRRSWQIGPEQVRIGGKHWPDTLKSVVQRAAEGLGVDEPVTATFYKLLVYDRGSFFVSHRDTEKQPGMFATLLLALPSQFSGGELVVRHKEREVRLDLRADDPAELTYAAFYADCVHEVLPVTDGYRLMLVYNLARSGRGRPPAPPAYEQEQERIAALLRAWGDSKGVDDVDVDEADVDEAGRPLKLIYPLEHAYTPAELGFDRLKGVDAAVAQVLGASARQAQCELLLALLTIQEDGAAEYNEDYNPRRRYSDDNEDEFEAGEVFDRTALLSDWRSPDGSAYALGEIPAEDHEFTPPGACQDLSPDEEHFREATGNEGATFERTYRQAALVLWPKPGLFDVLCQAGLEITLPYLENLVGAWAGSGAGKDSGAWLEAHRLAEAMLAQWSTHGWHPRQDKATSKEAQMLALLARLDDAGVIERFLMMVTAAGCFATGDAAAVVEALDHLELPLAVTLVERIVAATGKSHLDACANLVRRLATERAERWAARLADCALRLTEALLQYPGQQEAVPSWQARTRPQPSLVVDVLVGLGAIDATLCRRAVAQFLTHPRIYDMDAVLVPALLTLVGLDVAEHEGIEQLRSACLAHLRGRIAEPLAPPADWRRENKLGCNCVHCQALAGFLADPLAAKWHFRATEHERGHVADTIRRAACDVSTETEKRGRPYTLVCTKNQASYARRAKQREQDLRNLKRLTG